MANVCPDGSVTLPLPLRDKAGIVGLSSSLIRVGVEEVGVGDGENERERER